MRRVSPRLAAATWFAGNAALIVLSAAAARARGPLFEEDGLVETGTALCFLAAAVLGIACLMAYPAGRHRLLLGLASGLGLLGFLDEISFGARLFGWSAPALAGGGEFDGAHDVVILVYRLGVETPTTALAALCASLVLVAALGLVHWRRRVVSLIRQARTEPPVGLFAVFITALAAAGVLDLGLGPRRHLAALEELVELNAALALLLAVLSTGATRRPPPSGRSAPASPPQYRQS